MRRPFVWVACRPALSARTWSACLRFSQRFRADSQGARHDRVLDRHALEERRDCDDLVRCLGDFNLPVNEALARREAAEMVGALAAQDRRSVCHRWRSPGRTGQRATQAPRRWKSPASRVAKMSPRWLGEGPIAK